MGKLLFLWYRREPDMDIIHVGLCIADRDFAMALARGISRESRCIQFHMENGRTCELILVDEGADGGSSAVQLTDIRCRSDPERGILYRYEACSSLARQIVYQYYRITGRPFEPMECRRSRLVAFAAVSGGTGVTACAVAVARMMKILYGKRCIYLNLQTVNDSVRYFRQEGGTAVRRLIYELNRSGERKEQILLWMESVIAGDGDPDYLNTSAFNEIAEDIDEKLLDRLILALDQMGRYDYILLDLGNDFRRRDLHALKRCDCGVLLRQREPSQETVFTKAMLHRVMETAPALIQVLCGPRSGEERGEKVCSICCDRTSFIRMNGQIRINLRRNYGRDIAVLTKKIAGICSEYGQIRDQEETLR